MNVCKKNIKNLLYITLIIFIIIPIIFYIFFPLKEQFLLSDDETGEIGKRGNEVLYDWNNKLKQNIKDDYIDLSNNINDILNNYPNIKVSLINIFNNEDNSNIITKLSEILPIQFYKNVRPAIWRRDKVSINYTGKMMFKEIIYELIILTNKTKQYLDEIKDNIIDQATGMENIDINTTIQNIKNHLDKKGGRKFKKKMREPLH